MLYQMLVNRNQVSLKLNSKMLTQMQMQSQEQNHVEQQCYDSDDAELGPLKVG